MANRSTDGEWGLTIVHSSCKSSSPQPNSATGSHSTASLSSGNLASGIFPAFRGNRRRPSLLLCYFIGNSCTISCTASEYSALQQHFFEPGSVDQSEKQAIEYEQQQILQQLEDWLELPMLVLSFAWLGLFVVELTSLLGHF
ncbi:MAG TPA: hypothetical protein V6C57_23910 [Coleofasciculaceae cyanobacterium]